MLPRWAYGFWQSRQRYETQDQLLGVLAEYRRRRLPLDNIVQDWRYWAENDWGSHLFEASRFPNPQAMIDQVHAQGAHIMISVWPKFYPETDNYRELAAVGGLYRATSRPARATGSGPATSTPSTIPTIAGRGTFTGARSATGSPRWAWTPGGSMRASPTSIPISRSRNGRGGWARPRSGPARPISIPTR